MRRDDGATSPPVLEVLHADGLSRLRLNRPERLNALNGELCAAITEELADLESNHDRRVIVIEGAGRSFSSGADLQDGPVTETGASWSARRRDQFSWQRVLEMLDRTSQVTVAALHGHVVGGAALLAAACDIRIAAADTQLRIPELALGIPLTWGGIPLLVREIGLPLTRDWVLSGRRIGIDELLRSGFVQHAVASEELAPAVDDYVATLLDLSPPVLAMTKSMTSALDRSHPAMVAGWADADLLQWSFGENRPRNTPG